MAPDLRIGLISWTTNKKRKTIASYLWFNITSCGKITSKHVVLSGPWTMNRLVNALAGSASVQGNCWLLCYSRGIQTSSLFDEFQVWYMIRVYKTKWSAVWGYGFYAHTWRALLNMSGVRAWWGLPRYENTRCLMFTSAAKQHLRSTPAVQCTIPPRLVTLYSILPSPFPPIYTWRINTHYTRTSCKALTQQKQPRINTRSRSWRYVNTFPHHRFRSFVSTRRPCSVSTIWTASPVAPQMSSTGPLTSTCSKRARTWHSRSENAWVRF